jgi:hypothetical protein
MGGILFLSEKKERDGGKLAKWKAEKKGGNYEDGSGNAECGKKGGW